jgi:hypothetical protein
LAKSKEFDSRNVAPFLAPMTAPFSLEESRRLVAQAARDFVPMRRTHEHPLSPFADSIVALREKHASYRVIANILHAAGVIVSHHSVARFCRDALRMKARKKGAAPMRAKSSQGTSRKPASERTAEMSQRTPRVDLRQVIAQRRAEENQTVSRERGGPRIPDPRNL